jgi:hypothetical protein
MTEIAADERPQTKPFAAFVQEQRRGALHTEVSDQLAELVHACVETGKKGTLTLQITVAPTKNEEGTVLVTDDIKVKAPKPDARPAIFFTDEHGNLSRQDPRQAELPLREVPGGRASGGASA